MSLTPGGCQVASRGRKPGLPPFPSSPPQLPLALSSSLLPSRTYHPRMSESEGHSESIPPNLLPSLQMTTLKPTASLSGTLPSMPGDSEGCPPLPCMVGGPHLLPQPKVSKPRLQREHELPAGLPEAPDFFRVLLSRLTPQDHTFQLLLQGKRPWARPHGASLSSGPSTPTPQLFSRSRRPGSKCGRWTSSIGCCLRNAEPQTPCGPVQSEAAFQQDVQVTCVR